jgi:hypothetical protein
MVRVLGGACSDLVFCMLAFLSIGFRFRAIMLSMIKHGYLTIVMVLLLSSCADIALLNH